MKISQKTLAILGLIAEGHSYEQILNSEPDFTYLDIFTAAKEAVQALTTEPSAYEARIATIREKHARAYEPWTEEEEYRLVGMYKGGAPIHAISSALKRQPGAIRGRLKKLGIEI